MGRKQFSALVAAVIGLGLSGGLVSWVFIGHSASAQKTSESISAESSPSKVILTEEIRLIDQDRKVRATLSVQPDGSMGLHFIDQEGRPRLAVGLLADGSPVLNLADQNSRIRT